VAAAVELEVHVEDASLLEAVSAGTWISAALVNVLVTTLYLPAASAGFVASYASRQPARASIDRLSVFTALLIFLSFLS
jgi:hypothetical protein